MESRALQRRSGPLFWLCFLPIFGLTLFAWWRYGIHEEVDQEPQVSISERTGFDLPEAPRYDAPASPAQPFTTQFERESKQRVDGRVRATGPGLTGFVPETRPKAAAPAVSSKRQQELDFIKTFDPMIRAEQRKLKKIIDKHYKKHKVLRRFDKEVQGMPRVMELGRQYSKDRDFYKWSRSVVQLPEFRGLVSKYATDFEAWKAGTSMVFQALKNPPPPPVYTELLKVFTEDPVVSRHTTQMVGPVLANMPVMLVQSIPKGENPELLQGFASELVPGGASLSLVDSSKSNRYWQGYKDGYAVGFKEGQAVAASRRK